MIPKKPIEYHNWGCGRFFKKLVLGMLLHFVVMPARAQWQPGGIPIHNHTGPNDGGQLSNLNVLGYVKTPEIIADTVTFSSSTFDNITVQNVANIANIQPGITAEGSSYNRFFAPSGYPGVDNLFYDGSGNYIWGFPEVFSTQAYAVEGGQPNFTKWYFHNDSQDFETPYLMVDDSATIAGNASVRGNSFSVGGSTLVVTQGNVGIATDNPSQSLEVNGKIKSDANGGNLIFNADSGYEWWTGAYTDLISYQITHREIASPNNYSTDFAITTAGNVGIGTASPGAPLEVSGANGSGVGLIVDSSATVKQTLSIGLVNIQSEASSSSTCQAYCPTNTVALGGGCSDTVLSSNPLLTSTSNGPTGQLNNAWNCDFTLSSGNCYATVICARLGP